MKKIEEWKTVDNAPDYEVSRNGLIRNAKTKRLLKPCDNGHGYMYITLCINRKHKKEYIHRVVARMFCKNNYSYFEVNHKNGIKSDNRANNLEWVSRSGNELHKCRQLNRYGGPNKKVKCIETNIIFDSINEAKRWVGKKHINISNCAKGKKNYNTAGGYHWRFL